MWLCQRPNPIVNQWLVCLQPATTSARQLWRVRHWLTRWSLFSLWISETSFNHWLRRPAWLNSSKLNTDFWYLQKRKSYKLPQHLQSYKWSHCRISIFFFSFFLLDITRLANNRPKPPTRENVRENLFHCFSVFNWRLNRRQDQGRRRRCIMRTILQWLPL